MVNFSKLLLVILGLVSYVQNISAQYDDGTIIYSETSNTNLASVLNNYVVVDFDGDSNVDIIMIKDSTDTAFNELIWYKGDGNGNFSIQGIISSVENKHKKNEIFYADMNEDDIDDLIFQNSNTGFTVLLSDGLGNISSQKENTAVTGELIGADLMEIADIDGDGDMDGIFWAKIDSVFVGTAGETFFGHCLIGYNDGSGLFSNYDYLDNDNPEFFLLIETGDLDGDDDLDIICSGSKEIQMNGGEGVTSYESPFVRFYENLGADGFADKVEMELPIIDSIDPDFTHIKINDIDGDGNDELLVEYAIRDECGSDLHLSDCIYFYRFHVLDYDVINEDFVLLQEFNSWFHGYVMKNQNIFHYDEFYEEAFLIQFGKNNTDSNLDILSVNVPQGKLLWYHGDGDGDFSNTVDINSNSLYSSIRPALRAVDVDNDSDLDIFVLLNNETSSTLTVFKNLALVGTKDIDFHNSDLDLFPNPSQSNSYVQFALPSNQNLSNLSYKITNLSGENLTSGTCNEGRLFIPDMLEGVYIIEILDADKKYVGKLVIK